MKSSRHLVLRKETLTVLGAADMRRVAGGTHLTCEPTHGPTFDDECQVPTNPVNHCLTLDTCTPQTGVTLLQLPG